MKHNVPYLSAAIIGTAAIIAACVSERVVRMVTRGNATALADIVVVHKNSGALGAADQACEHRGGLIHAQIRMTIATGDLHIICQCKDETLVEFDYIE